MSASDVLLRVRWAWIGAGVAVFIIHFFVN